MKIWPLNPTKETSLATVPAHHQTTNRAPLPCRLSVTFRWASSPRPQGLHTRFEQNTMALNHVQLVFLPKYASPVSLALTHSKQYHNSTSTLSVLVFKDKALRTHSHHHLGSRHGCISALRSTTSDPRLGSKGLQSL